MPFICYVYERREDVPYMEVLTARTFGEAREKAKGLLIERPHCLTAELWEDERLIGAFDRGELVS
jgi:hypothetical protein